MAEILPVFSNDSGISYSELALDWRGLWLFD